MNHDNGRLTHPPGEKKYDKKNVTIGLSKPIEHQLGKQKQKSPRGCALERSQISMQLHQYRLILKDC